jgi:hypothetical protein
VAFSTIKGLSYTYLRYKAAVSIPIYNRENNIRWGKIVSFLYPSYDSFIVYLQQLSCIDTITKSLLMEGLKSDINNFSVSLFIETNNYDRKIYCF